MPILQQYILAIGAFQGLLLSGLLSIGSQVTIASRILGVWCLIFCLSFLNVFITLEKTVNSFSSLIGWLYFLPATYGAFLYLYCKYAITDQKFSFKDLLHALPLLVCYTLNIDILLASPELKLNLAVFDHPDSASFKLSLWIMYLQAIVYLGFSFALVKTYRQQANNTLSNFNPDIFGWLLKLITLYMVIWCLKLLPTVIDEVAILSKIGDGLIVLMIYSVAMAQWRNPMLFKVEQFQSANTNRNIDTNSKNLSEETITDVNEQQKSGALNPEIRANLLNIVREHMQQQQAFLDGNLTLTRLAQAVGVSNHHLSEVLNQQEGKNFYQFVNEYRINYICEQLAAEHSSKLLELALEAGFSSKSTFNAVFKQFKGVTPSQYRKDLQQK